jgi:uncharacterized membrane protein
LFISLIPFTTAFISEFPYSFEAITVYGTILFLASFFGAWMYYYIAFKSDLMHDSVSVDLRKKLWKQIRLGPVSFFVAILLGRIHVAIPICIYILMPFFYMFMKDIDLVQGNKKDD